MFLFGEFSGHCFFISAFTLLERKARGLEGADLAKTKPQTDQVVPMATLLTTCMPSTSHSTLVFSLFALQRRFILNQAFQNKDCAFLCAHVTAML